MIMPQLNDWVQSLDVSGGEVLENLIGTVNVVIFIR